MKTRQSGNLFYFFILNFALFSGYANAQAPPDHDGLLNGEGMGQAQYAEMNGYPGPKHILDLVDKLKLSDAQKKSIQEIYQEMNARVKELGKRIIGVEEEMHEAFRTGLVNESSVRDDAEQIGRMRGKLRAVHLIAHIKAKKLMTDDQIALYTKLRAEEQSPSSKTTQHKH